jgi:hypothetical protein
VYFELLHARLVDHLRGRVKSGGLTERGLARLAGISQPHLHNVLKGLRVLSPATADVVVTNLRLSALDLVREDELAAPGCPVGMPRTREVPLAGGLLGPGHPFPDLTESAGALTFPATELQGIADPVAVRLAPDAHAPAVFHAGDIVLLQLVPPDGPRLQPGGYYVIDGGGCGLLRLYEGEAPAGAWAVRARAIWIGRYLRT